nr:subtilisin-like protease SBT4.4 [Malus domestica]
MSLMQVHIVYMGSLPDGNPAYSPLSHHLSILQRVVRGSLAETILVRSYKRSFNGFAANLTDQERKKIANMEEIVSVFPSIRMEPQTTRSWDFMGFDEKVSRNATTESDIIVGVMDTGIWPEAEGFKDEGFGPPPKKWKGVCEGGKNFTCNKYIVGARYYLTDSARDFGGHGTHCASIVAGSPVKDVSFYRLANGTAGGGVPAARIAAYKVCDLDFGCSSDGILAAFDDAIADEVDLISNSLNGFFRSEPHFYIDPVAIGAFHAMKKGILTSQSAGTIFNSDKVGPVSSVAPWIFTVAASTTDRRIIDSTVLANGKKLVGHSTNTFTLNGTNFPLVYGKDASRTNCSQMLASICWEGCLDPDLVKGKIVVCEKNTGIPGTYRSGAVGIIFVNFMNETSSQVLPFPGVNLITEELNVVKSYMNSTRVPQATILQSEVIKDVAAPLVSITSATGPNLVVPDIIKPDISAPGVEILAAYSTFATASEYPEDNRHVKYNILSGTSVSCPHVAGAAAYVKSFHPDWSLAAIKSSLMTTAWPMNDTGVFAYGFGHIDPVKAINPGLVYETSEDDHIKLLCTVYDEGKVRLITGENITCPKDPAKWSPRDHNYPLMGAKVDPMKPFTVQFHRTVKNVGLANSTYRAKIFSNSKLDIKVVPEVLSFKSLNEQMDFDVTVGGSDLQDRSQVSGSLVWSDGTHSVRSPILVYAYVPISSRTWLHE